MTLLKEVVSKLEKQQEGIEKKGLKDLPPIEKLLNVVEAARFVAKMLKEGVRTLIVGDYDTDGIMATTVVIAFLRDLGFSEEIVDYIIPSRLRDGYGLSSNIIDYALEKDFQMIITVDNGIAAVDAIAYAKENGLKVVITDHHTAPAVLPDADFIVNPKQPGETFPFIEISGATVAWYFIAALREECDAQIDIRKYLDFVAITVVSDVMPLTDINIGLLNYGLAKIKEQKRHIYRLLWNDWTVPTLNETDLSFSLVPMINAVGRINDANIGVQLFLSEDQDFIEDKFYFIKEINEKRKAMTRAFLDNAEGILDVEFDDSQKAIIIRNKDYHEGIVGIIAGKLAEEFQRPSYVFSWNEKKGVWKGSARSIGEVHLYNLTNKAKDYTFGFGGHKGAVGLAIKPEQWDDFKATIEAAALEIPKEDFIDTSLVPIECDLDDINMELLSSIDKFAPFGEGNPPILFKSKAKVKTERDMKDGLHFKCNLITSQGKSISGLFFNVKKHIFTEQIKEETPSFTFSPLKKYSPKTNTFSFELSCKITN